MSTKKPGSTTRLAAKGHGRNYNLARGIKQKQKKTQTIKTLSTNHVDRFKEGDRRRKH